jgi:hypothetical protein
LTIVLQILANAECDGSGLTCRVMPAMNPGMGAGREKEDTGLKEPEKLLDVFRTDVGQRHLNSALLRQFDLEFPRGKRQRNKGGALGRGMAGTAAVLSLLLVTGLSIGMGSAFAENEWVKDVPPPDLPAVKPKVEIRLPVVGSPETENPGSDGIPGEIKKVNPGSEGKEKKIDKPKKEQTISDSPAEGEQPTSQPPREVAPTSGSSGKGEEHGGLPQHRGGSSQSTGGIVSNPPTRPREVAPASGSSGKGEKYGGHSQDRDGSSQSSGGTVSNPPTRPREVAPTSGSSGKGEEHGGLPQHRDGLSQSSGGTVSTPHRNSGGRHILVPERVTARQKSGSAPSGGKGTQKAVGVGNDSTKQSSRQSPKANGSVTGNMPKTVKGGALPQTAGNDLNGVVAGGAVALLGAFHALRRSRVDPS